MPSINEYIQSLERQISEQKKLIVNLKKLVSFYEEIILNNDELKDKMEQRKKFNYYKGNERRKH